LTEQRDMFRALIVIALGIRVFIGQAYHNTTLLKIGQSRGSRKFAEVAKQLRMLNGVKAFARISESGLKFDFQRKKNQAGRRTGLTTKRI
jgi:hypothetical protein